MYPGLSYSDALGQSGLFTLFERREALTLKLFDEITTNPEHRLHKLLPAKKQLRLLAQELEEVWFAPFVDRSS